jgi:hypothetical protein
MCPAVDEIASASSIRFPGAALFKSRRPTNFNEE